MELLKIFNNKKAFKKQKADQEYEIEKKLTTSQQGPWYLSIDDKIWKKSGKPVEFLSRTAAQSAGLTILRRNPDAKVFATKDLKDG